MNFPVSSHRVDWGVQAILGCLCHSAVWVFWTVHPRWSGLWHQTLETEPTDQRIALCHKRHLHLVNRVSCFDSFWIEIATYFCLIPTRFIPESARWLMSSGRIEEAKELIDKAARVNKRNVPEFLLEKVFRTTGI